MPQFYKITRLGEYRRITHPDHFHRTTVVMAMLLLLGSWPAKVFSQADFYSGKTITIIQDGTPGGVGHLRTNAVIASLKKHIPGSPNIVIQFMEGAGGR